MMGGSDGSSPDRHAARAEPHPFYSFSHPSLPPARPSAALPLSSTLNPSSMSQLLPPIFPDGHGQSLLPAFPSISSFSLNAFQLPEPVPPGTTQDELDQARQMKLFTKYMNVGMESCVFKGTMAGVMGCVQSLSLSLLLSLSFSLSFSLSVPSLARPALLLRVAASRALHLLLFLRFAAQVTPSPPPPFPPLRPNSPRSIRLHGRRPVSHATRGTAAVPPAAPAAPPDLAQLQPSRPAVRALARSLSQQPVS